MIIPVLNITLSTLNLTVKFTCSPHYSNILGVMQFARWIFVKNGSNLTPNQHFLSSCFQWYFINTYCVLIDYWYNIYCINKSHQYAALEPGHQQQWYWPCSPRTFVSGTYFTNDFSITIQMWWKFHLALIQLLMIILQQHLAHATTAQLLCHVPNIVAITLLVFGWEQNEISITFEMWWKNC